MKFRTTLLQADKNATGIQIPDEVVESLGAGKRPPVRVTINGYTYRNTVAVMGGVFMVGVSAEHRKGANVAGGDEVDVDIELDTEPRVVTVPPDFQAALDNDVEAQRFFEVALQAVLRLKQRAVFVTRDLSQLPSSLPPEVMAVEYAPFSTLLKQAACFVHHGGIGTLSQGFAAGVPQLLMPMAHDQPDNENRLRRLGAGMGLTPRKFTSERVAAALEELLLSPQVSASVAKCAELTRNRPGPEAMIEWIETKALR